MSSKLKIYACSGLGNVPQAELGKYTYWTDNTNSVYNTQAQNTLLLFINNAIIEINYLNLNDEEIRYRLNQIDLWAVSLHFASKYRKDDDALVAAGRAIASVIDMGVFDYPSIDNDARDRHLSDLIDAVDKAVSEEKSGNSKFLAWWDKYVVSRNMYGFTKEQAAEVTKSLSGGGSVGSVDWESNKDLAKYFNDSGRYFLYTYFTKEELKKLPYVFTRKAKFQNAIYQQCLTIFKQMCGSEDEMQTIIRAGIIKDTGKTPEEIKDIILGKEGVGDVVATLTALIPLIVAVIGLISDIIKKILQAKSSEKIQEGRAIDEEAIAYNGANQSDFDGLLGNGSGLSTAGIGGTSGVLLIGAIIASLFLFRN